METLEEPPAGREHEELVAGILEVLRPVVGMELLGQLAMELLAQLLAG